MSDLTPRCRACCGTALVRLDRRTEYPIRGELHQLQWYRCQVCYELTAASTVVRSYADEGALPADRAIEAEV